MNRRSTISQAHSRIPQSGFTLLEMLIALSIVVLLSGITVESIMKSRSQTALNQTAQELALLFRDVQQKGISVSAIRINNRTFYPSYGVQLSMANDNRATVFPDLPVYPIGSPNSGAINSRDEDNDGVVDSTAKGNLRMNRHGQYWEDEQMPKYQLNQRVRISALKYDNAGFATDVPGGVLHVIYHRPDPTVYLATSNGDELITQHAWVCLQTTDGSSLKRRIDVWKTGQVSVSNSATAIDCP